MLTGEKPSGPIQLPSRKVQVDIRIDDIVLRALERTPEMRYQTAAEFRTAVETVASSAPPTRAEDEPVGARKASPDRSWMRVLGFILLVPGIPLGIFGLVMLWLVLNDGSWHPSPGEALVTRVAGPERRSSSAPASFSCEFPEEGTLSTPAANHLLGAAFANA